MSSVNPDIKTYSLVTLLSIFLLYASWNLVKAVMMQLVVILINPILNETVAL